MVLGSNSLIMLARLLVSARGPTDPPYLLCTIYLHTYSVPFTFFVPFTCIPKLPSLTFPPHNVLLCRSSLRSRCWEATA